MIGTFLLALALAQAAAAAPPEPGTEAVALSDEPPEAIVDFLGRRRKCLALTEEGAGPPGFEWEHFRCAAIPEEERALRRKQEAGGPAYRRWLDSDPRAFRLGTIVITTYEWQAPTRLARIARSGADARGAHPFRVSIDARAAGGRSTLLSLRQEGRSATVYLDNRRFPDLDLQSLRTLIDPRPGSRGGLLLILRFGYPRGWCNAVNDDDRPRIELRLSPEGAVTGYWVDMTNCRHVGIDLDPRALARPPGGG